MVAGFVDFLIRNSTLEEKYREDAIYGNTGCNGRKACKKGSGQGKVRMASGVCCYSAPTQTPV